MVSARTASSAIAVALLAAVLVPGVRATAAPKPKPKPKPTRTQKATFGIGPANSKRLDGRPYLNYLASPGSALNDHVAIVNISRQKLVLNIYVVDATVGLDGSFGYLARSAARTDAGAWIKPRTADSTITLAPRTSKIVPLAVDIPKNAEPGDHAAGIVVSLTSRVTSSTGPVNFEQRVALRAFVRVNGPLHAQLQVERLSAKYHGSLNPLSAGSVTVRYRVHNAGNVRLGARQRLTVSGLFGTEQPKAKLKDVPILLPGTSLDVTATVPNVLPQFRLTTRVTLYPLVIAGDVDPKLAKQFSSTATTWAVPWALLVLIALAAFVVAAIWYLHRIRSRRVPPAPSGTAPSAPREPVLNA